MSTVEARPTEIEPTHVVRDVFDQKVKDITAAGGICPDNLLALLNNLMPAGWEPTRREMTLISKAMRDMRAGSTISPEDAWAQLTAYVITFYDRHVRENTNGLYVRVE